MRERHTARFGARLPLLLLLLLGLCFVLGAATTNVVDEALYSRQLYVLGLPAQQRLAASNVLVVGLGGVGVELAKNVILAGPRSVTLLDPTPARWEDLATQYYLDEDSLGKPRARESFGRLKELNPLVQLHLLEPKGDGGIDHVAKAIEASGQKYDVVVAADQGKAAEEALNALARKLNAKFVAAQAPGLFGTVFCDFGDGFTVNDTDGREAKTGIVKSVEAVPGGHDDETLVTLVDGERHDLSKGDAVLLEAAGDQNGDATCLEADSFPVQRIVTPTSFTLPASAALTAQAAKFKGGRFRQLKRPVQLAFQPLRQARRTLASLPTDFGKASLGRQLTLHACFESLETFKAQHKGRLPKPGSAADAKAFKKLVTTCDMLQDVITTHAAAFKAKAAAAKSAAAKKRVFQPPVLDERVMEVFSRTCRGSLAPICSFVGGTAAQEVLKACTGTFVPLQQYLFFDAIEVLLPEETDDAAVCLPSEADCAPRGDRYDGQRAALGDGLQRLIQDQAVFVVGAGAIGCELLKNLALMGVGVVTVTDNDTIEKSNLNRQFLFREKDLGSPKSEAAAAAVRRMNPDMDVTPLVKKVGKETEGVFNDEFWFGHDVVANALDNVEARMYVDGRCVYYRRPLLESGTEGTSGNVQVVVPFVTESYGSSADPPEASIPVCTLKSFPYLIEHCIQWARDFFDGYFRIQPERLNDLLVRLGGAGDAQPVADVAAEAVLVDLRAQTSDETLLRDLEGMLLDLEIWDPVPSVRRCVKWALDRFHELYQANIEGLLREHPPNSVTEDGDLFWSGDRRTPTALAFDRHNPLHLDFVVTAALLKARAFNVVEATTTVEDMAGTVQGLLDEILGSGYQPPPAHVVVGAEEEEDLEARVRREFEEVRQAMGRIAARGGSPTTRPEIFEKDQDSNGHIAFVTSASNLRAANYGLALADRLQTKKIAGRIIPAIATTTAVVAGLASLELCKLAQRSTVEEEEAYVDEVDEANETGETRGGTRRRRRHRPPLEAYRNAFINLAGPFFGLTQPMEAPPIALGEQGEVYNMWDRLELAPKKELTLRGLLDHTLEHFGLQVTSVTLHGSKILYADFMHPDEDHPVFAKTVAELVAAPEEEEEEAGEGEEAEAAARVPKQFVDLEIECVDDDGEEVESPPIRYFFPLKKAKGKRGGVGKAIKWWGTALKSVMK